MGANVGKLEQSKTQKLFGSNERNDTLFDTISQACFFLKVVTGRERKIRSFLKGNILKFRSTRNLITEI